jgi:hypothetical protein
MKNVTTDRGEQGFSAVEMLISTAIMMVITGSVFGLMNPAHGTFKSQPEVSDMQQRMRIGVDTLQKDILMAGAGAYSGARVGTLGNFMATIVPDREGNVTPDPPGTFKCTTNFCDALDASDSLTVMYVPPTSAQTTIANAMPSNSSEIKVKSQPGCPNNDPLCGFKVGMQVMIFDETGTYDAFSITNVQAPSLHLQHKGVDFAKSYDSTASIAQIATYTYWLKTDTVAESYQLMRYDGFETDLPVAENVVGLAFEYFGEPAAPAILKALTDPKGPWTNYGPKPPVVGVDPPDAWGPGENCLFEVVGGKQVPRSTMPNLGPGGQLVKLGKAKLTDGPWCPDGTTGNRYDADLLRVRKVKVTMRVQVGPKSLRGPAGTLFLRAGTSRGAYGFVPDHEISFEVTPRNLNFGR